MGHNGQARIVRGYGLYEQLREYKPAMLIAVDGDGGEVKINVPDVRNKHARVMQALREVAWVRVDLLDKKGGLVYRHQRNADDRDVPAGELEDLPPTRAVAELTGLVSVMLRAQETVLVHHQRATNDSQQAMMRVVESSLRRLELQEAQIEHAMRLNWQLSQDLVNAQLAQLQLAPGPAPTDEDGNARPRSDAAIDALMPALIRSALAPKPPTSTQPSQPPTQAQPAPKKNGATPKQAQAERREPASSSQND